MKTVSLWTSTRQLSSSVCATCTKQLKAQSRSYSTTRRASPEIFDVVCVGGGPAGLSVLAALRAHAATAGLKVALIESQNLAKTRTWTLPRGEYSNRCSSLTPASVSFLSHIGAWEHIQRSRVQSYDEMQVWDGITGSRIEFNWPDRQSGRTIAYMTENANLQAALLKRTDELGGVRIFDGSRVESIDFGEESELADLRQWPIVSLSSGQSLAARLLVGADGANSPVRAFAGIKSEGWDYNAHAVVASMHMQDSGWGGEEHKIAYQRFLPSGPAAMLPLPDSNATLVWSTTPARAAHLKTLGSEDFTAMVNAAFRLSSVDIGYMHTISSGQAEELAWRTQHTAFDTHRIPRAAVSVQAGSIASFPLKMRHADTYIGERVALLGDAAHTIHPLAGQGLNQGLGDVESLVNTIMYAVKHGMDIGTRLSLENYVSDRYARNHVLLGVVDKLEKLYSIGGGPMVGLRSFGLRAANALGPFKGFVMGQAAGTGAKLF